MQHHTQIQDVCMCYIRFKWLSQEIITHTLKLTWLRHHTILKRNIKSTFLIRITHYTVIQDTQSLHRIQETQYLIRIAQSYKGYTSLWQQWNLDPVLSTTCPLWMITDKNYKGENHIGSLLNLWLGLRTVMKRWVKECQEW